MALSFFLSFFTGLLAALNPCVAPIYPLVFSYYLKKNEQVSWKNVILFVTGFLSAFLLLALILLLLGGIENIQEYIRFAAAGIIGLLGIHFLLKGLKIPLGIEQRLENIENPFFFGIVFGLALNPCSLPLFLANTAITITNAFNWLNILAFGIGIAIPPVLTAVFGATLIRQVTKRVRGAYLYLDKIIGIFLFIAAGFLVWTVGATPITSTAASLTILLFFALLIGPYWKKIFLAKTERTPLITLTAFLFLLWGVLTFHCTQVVYSTQFTCGVNCGPCRLCLSLLLIVLLIGYAGFFVLEKSIRK